VLRVARLDGEELVLDGLGLSRAFFTGDAGDSSFDALAGGGNPDRIELADVVTMNRTARARSPHKAWARLIDADAPWLSSLGPDLDLIGLDDRRWQAVGADALVGAALRATIGPGRGMAVATKLLHLKRPRLFPMLDRYVAEMLGAGLPDAGADEGRVATAISLTQAIRSEGRRNLGALAGIQRRLADDDVGRSLVRIFDAILWLAHPAARTAGAPRVLSAGLRRD
jgi:Family of unknown function (DUF6308)